MINPADSTREIVTRYCQQLPSEISGLASLLEVCSTDESRRESTVKEFHHEVHRMAGAAHCMGFPFLGNELGNVEFLLLGLIERGPEAGLKDILEVANRLQAVARLKGYVTPQNSGLLRAVQQSQVQQISAEDPKPSRAILPSSFSAQRIVFADDDMTIRMLMREMLTNLGVRSVETAVNGQEALQILERFNATIVITDWRMKPVSGMDLLKRIRGGKTMVDRDCPVIFLTSSNTVKDVKLAINEGANHFLVKPFTTSAVEKALHQVILRTHSEEMLL